MWWPCNCLRTPSITLIPGVFVTRQSLATPGAQPVREVMFYLFEGLPLRLQQPEVEEEEPDAVYTAVQPEGAVKQEAVLDVQVRLRGEEEEHVAGGGCDSAGEAACPERKHLAQ